MWAMWNLYFASYVVRHSLRMRQERDDHRFAEHLAVRVRAEGDGVASVFPAITSDLNPTGLGFRATQGTPEGARVHIELPLATGPVVTAGTVRHVAAEDTTNGTVYKHGVQFDELSIDARDAIELHCTQHAMPVWRQRYRQSIDIVTRASEVMRSTRRERRQLVRLPAEVAILDGTALPGGEPNGVLILEELSARGAQLVGNYALDPGTRIHIAVPGPGSARRRTALRVSTGRPSGPARAGCRGTGGSPTSPDG